MEHAKSEEQNLVKLLWCLDVCICSHKCKLALAQNLLPVALQMYRFHHYLQSTPIYLSSSKRSHIVAPSSSPGTESSGCCSVCSIFSLR